MVWGLGGLLGRDRTCVRLGAVPRASEERHWGFDDQKLVVINFGGGLPLRCLESNPLRRGEAATPRDGQGVSSGSDSFSKRSPQDHFDCLEKAIA